MKENVIRCTDGKFRCRWCTADQQYIDYHDQEWGKAESGDNQLFEKLTLESFQSGLSWRTILVKRDNFRRAFAEFEIACIAAFDISDIETLLNNEGIVRHRGKIEATINNAKRALELIEQHHSLAAYFSQYYAPLEEAPSQRSTSPTADKLAKDLKKRGWKFLGPTTIYSFMQATGMVNDHDPNCDFYQQTQHHRTEVLAKHTTRTT